METSFPRGSSTSHSTTTTDVSDKTNNKEIKNKKSSTITSATKKKRSADVLFGGASLPTDDSTTDEKMKHSSSKRRKKKEHFDATTTTSASSSSHTSLMPLGGGGVILSTSSSSKATSVDATTTTTSSTTELSTYYPNGYIESLSFNKLHSGVLLWSIVREVHDDLIVFSLPNQWTAYMLRGQEVDALSSSGNGNKDVSNTGTPCNVMLQKGQMISVKILQAVQESSSNKKGGSNSGAGPKRRIQVTCLPQKINPIILAPTSNHSNMIVRGQVTSIEDFGLLIDLGYGRRGFLSFNDIDGDYYCTNEEKDELVEKNNGSTAAAVVATAHCLLEGRIMDFVVGKTTTSSSSTTTTTTTPNATRSSTTMDAGAVIPLRLPRPQDMISEYFLPGSRPTDIFTKQHQQNALLPSLQDLQPGLLVRARVEAMVRNGLCVSFGGNQNSVYRGAIEVQHLGGFWIPSNKSSHGHDNKQHGDDWKNIFDIYRNVTARIIAIDAKTKLIRLTLLPHLLQGNCRSLSSSETTITTTPASSSSSTTTTPQLPEVGTIVEGATVVRLDPGIGALLALPSAPVAAVSDDEHESMQLDNDDDDDKDDDMDKESKKKKKKKDKDGPLSVLRQSFWDSESYQKASKVQAVYVHISKAMDGVANTDNDNKASRVKTPETVFSKEFAPSTKHTVRILSTANLMEGIPAGATAKSIVQAHVLTHADLKPGQVYKQVPVCAQMEGGSIMVHFGMGVKGLIPAMHLFDHAQQYASDYRSKIRKIKYAVNAKVDVRVLHVNAERKECIVTAKKALVKAPNNEILVAFSDAKVGMNVTGFVSRILDHGLSVTCFNRVHGRVTVRSLRNELGIDNHKENFSIGDVVQCRIVNIRRRKRHYSRRHNNAEDDDHDHDDVNDNDHENNDNDNIDAAAANADEHGNHRTYWELTLNVRKHQSEQDGIDENEDELEQQVDELAEERVDITAGSILPAGSLCVTELVKGKAKAKGFVPGYAVVAVKSKQLAANGYDTTGMVKVIECKLPFDQLVDEYKSEHLTSVEALDDFALSILKKVGKKINKKAMVLEDPKKSRSEFLTGTGHFVILTLRPKLIELAETQATTTHVAGSVPRGSSNPLLPGPDTHLYKGANLLGYVGNLDPRHGGFVRFLDGFAGLMPKKEGGLDLPLYSTINTTIMAIDVTATPPKIVLTHDKRGGKAKIRPGLPNRGHRVQNVEIKHVGFNSATVKILDADFSGNKKVQARVHCAMATSEVLKGPLPLSNKSAAQREIPKCHPFYKWREGMTLSNLVVVGVSATRDGTPVIDLSTIFTTNEECIANVDDGEEDDTAKANMKDNAESSKDNDGNASGNMDDDKMITDDEKKSPFPRYYQKSSEIKKGSKVTGIVASISPHNGGLWILLTPQVSAFLPALEASQDINVLHNLGRCFPKGSRLECVVIDKATVSSKLHRQKAGVADAGDDYAHKQVVHVSLLADQADKPQVAAVVVGRVNRHLRPMDPPALMVDLRGGYTGRCCITELAEADDWTNMPLGKERHDSDERHHGNDDEKDMSTETALSETNSDDKFAHGSIVMCRVLANVPKKPIVDISCRVSRIEGDLEDDEPPEVGDTTQAYVKGTTKKGCFLRLSRQIDGRVLLKELSDGFVPDPAVSFPPGRLVVGKVKSVQEIDASKRKSCCKFTVELDMRESTLLDAQAKINFQEIQVGSKHKGTVTRIEDYGVFVQLENSEISGLTHKSECSDKYIKRLQDLYDPGDMVKVLVLKKDEDKKQIGFSMKASHFADDESSDDSSIDENVSDSDEEEKEEEGGGEPVKGGAVDSEDELDSEDENFVSKLAAKQDRDEQDDLDEEMEDAESKESEEESDNESDDDDDDGDNDNPADTGMDTNVGFDWDVSGLQSNDKSGTASDGDDDDSSSDESEDSEDGVQKASHKSRKKQAQKRREEQEIARRETALADGTADDNPETASDFERLLASSPNSSELWIRYMAFHLTLADISAARQVAERALQRIEFRLEREKLNVWCALLTLELKYGNEKSLKQAMDRACAQVNPKHVHLRVCEIMEKEASMAPGPGVLERTDDMYNKMCKKFKSKKKVWLANAEYLLKRKRNDEALALSKRALLSLASYKHVEMMSKFAQLVFEYGSAEQARTLFDGLLAKCPKRLDLLFVYADKEIKHGDVEMARSLFASVTAAATSTVKDKESSSSSSSARKMKLSDKQMKSLFKRWYDFEEKHGTDESREQVKDAARAYVEG